MSPIIRTLKSNNIFSMYIQLYQECCHTFLHTFAANPTQYFLPAILQWCNPHTTAGVAEAAQNYPRLAALPNDSRCLAVAAAAVSKLNWPSKPLLRASFGMATSEERSHFCIIWITTFTPETNCVVMPRLTSTVYPNT